MGVSGLLTLYPGKFSFVSQALDLRNPSPLGIRYAFHRSDALSVPHASRLIEYSWGNGTADFGFLIKG